MTTVGSVRTTRMPQSQNCAPEVQIFWPLTTQSSPSRTALLRRPARSEPAEGSEKSWHQISSPESSRGIQRFFCSGVPCARMVGPHMPMPIEKMSGGVWNFACSWFQITFSIGVASRPPYSLGQVMQAQPASAFFFCQACAAATTSGSMLSP